MGMEYNVWVSLAPTSMRALSSVLLWAVLLVLASACDQTEAEGPANVALHGEGAAAASVQTTESIDISSDLGAMAESTIPAALSIARATAHASKGVVSARGHGDTFGQKSFVYSFSAIDNAGGVNGQVEWNGVWNFHMDVTCLSVVGNRATISGVLTKGDTFPFLEGFAVQFTVIDNGEPGTDAPDRVANTLFYNGSGAIPCEFLGSNGFITLRRGNFQVKS